MQAETILFKEEHRQPGLRHRRLMNRARRVETNNPTPPETCRQTVPTEPEQVKTVNPSMLLPSSSLSLGRSSYISDRSTASNTNRISNVSSSKIKLREAPGKMKVQIASRSLQQTPKVQTRKKTEFVRKLSVRKIDLPLSVEPPVRENKNGFKTPAKKIKLAPISPAKGLIVEFKNFGGLIPESSVGLLKPAVESIRPVSRKLKQSATHDVLPELPQELQLSKKFSYNPQFDSTYTRSTHVLQKYSNPYLVFN